MDLQTHHRATGRQAKEESSTTTEFDSLRTNSLVDRTTKANMWSCRSERSAAQMRLQVQLLGSQSRTGTNRHVMAPSECVSKKMWHVGHLALCLLVCTRNGSEDSVVQQFCHVPRISAPSHLQPSMCLNAYPSLALGLSLHPGYVPVLGHQPVKNAR